MKASKSVLAMKPVEKPQLIPTNVRRSNAENDRELKAQIDTVEKKLSNFIGYWRENWKGLSAQEKLNAYTDIYTILDYQHNKKGNVYDALKDKIDAFVVPEYAKRGYSMWLTKGKKQYVKPKTGTLPRDAYNRMIDERSRNSK